MGIVILKISGDELLKNEDPKWVLDKVRAQRHFSVTSDNVESPPSNKERLSISREFQGHCKAVADPKEGPWWPAHLLFGLNLGPKGQKNWGGRPPRTPLNSGSGTVKSSDLKDLKHRQWNRQWRRFASKAEWAKDFVSPAKNKTLGPVCLGCKTSSSSAGFQTEDDFFFAKNFVLLQSCYGIQTPL